MRGYCGIGVYDPKFDCNVGTLLRSARALGAAFCFTVGDTRGIVSTDTTKSFRHMPTYHYADQDDFLAHLPKGAALVGVELSPDAESLVSFAHPEAAVYLLGNEARGIPPEVLARCQRVVQIPSAYCLNVAVAGAICLYDRIAKTARETDPGALP